MPIDIEELEEIVSASCFKEKPLKEKKHKKRKKLKREKSNGLESCDFGSIFEKDCGRIELRVCRTRTPSKPVPEPATMLLFGAGLAGIGVFMKKFIKA